MAYKRKLWNKSELTIAYYIARWGRKGIVQTQRELAESIIGMTTLKSLNCQIATFRYMMSIEGFQLRSTSKLKHEIVVELTHERASKVKQSVLTFIENRLNPFTDETMEFLYGSTLHKLDLNKFQNKL